MTIGGILGHCACTGAAVIGGRHLASHINEHTVAVSWSFGRAVHAPRGCGRMCLCGNNRAGRTMVIRAGCVTLGEEA